MTRQDIEEATALVEQILKQKVFPAIASLKEELSSAIAALKPPTEVPVETEQDEIKTDNEGGAS